MSRGGYRRGEEDGLVADQTGMVNYSARAANALVAIAVILLLIALSFEIPFFIKFFEWDNTCCGGNINTYTKTPIQYVETPTITECDLGDDCSVLQLWNATGTIVKLGTTTAIGNTWTECTEVGLDSTDPGTIWLCSKVYSFDGSGDITEGKITAYGDYFIPGNQSDVDAWRLTTWAVTGGTGSIYSKANGGQVTFTTTADAANMTGTITFNYVA